MHRKFDLGDGNLVVIIGSGAGGGTLGNELAQKGIRTVILEAGPRIEREQHIDDERKSFAQLTWLDKRLVFSPSRKSSLPRPTKRGWIQSLSSSSRWGFNNVCPRRPWP
jgi:choline dehydrogenase-like flavoprotein